MACPNCSNLTYCISGTGNPLYDDNFDRVGSSSYNCRNYYTGQTNGYYIYYSSGETKWCLSTTLGGTCLLFGPSPSTTTCPDLSAEFLFTGICPSPTPTPTNNCSVLDFEAVFDCLITFTPTPTLTSTPTPTPTPTPSYVCPIGVDSIITGYTPTPTVTPTVTPSNSPEVTRPCNFSGDVSFMTVESRFIAANSKQFEDCENGMMYYTSDKLYLPTPTALTEYMIFTATVDGLVRCISYVGLNRSVFGINNIELITGPIGFSNLGDCILCNVSNTPTPTPTLTPTPSSTPAICYCYQLMSGELTTFRYQDCDGNIESITTSQFIPQNVCSQTEPTTRESGIYSIDLVGYCTSGICPSITCNCYNVENNSNEFCKIVYYDCDGQIQFIGVQPNTVSDNFCSTTIPYIARLDKTNINIISNGTCVGGTC